MVSKLSLQNIIKVYDSRGIAGLHGIGLELKEGEIFTVMGPNGCGKTTFLNIISQEKARIQLFSSEQPQVDINVQKYLYEKVQRPMDDEKKIQLARDMADLFEFTFQLKQNFHQLSAGQKQKVLLAGSLMDPPEIFLMDEPFSHLDPHTRIGILHSLFHFIRLEKISVIWVTHQLDEALRYSDRMGIMNFGKWEQVGVPLDFIQSPKNLFVAQFMGQRNFLTIKFEEKWKTPWGDLDIKTHVQGPEAILILPHEWYPDESAQESTVKEFYTSTLGLMAIISHSGNDFHILWPPSFEPKLSLGLRLMPKLSLLKIIQL
jgi:ABC-type Fe3+/spermidine/putrescine transport system ATPase subunit